MLELICKELGIEIGDSWLGNTGKYYVINEHGQIRVWNDEYDQWIESYYDLSHVVTGALKPKWKPKDGEKYFTPHFTSDPNKCFCENVWRRGRTQDEWMYDNNLAFRTREEAIEYTLKMIALAKNGI